MTGILFQTGGAAPAARKYQHFCKPSHTIQSSMFELLKEITPSSSPAGQGKGGVITVPTTIIPSKCTHLTKPYGDLYKEQNIFL